ncbi:MAG: SDR family NAD(P)-dependent oxidoreductase [Actinomycetota bacterium]
MTGRLADRRIVVTGASRGLGRALAEAFAAEGAAVVVTARDTARLASVLRTLGERGHGVALELGDVASAQRAAREAVAALGRVDVVVNSAGILGVRGDLATFPVDTWQEVLAVNVTGPLVFTQGILPAMADGGVVVNVTSGASGRATWGAYAVAKAAVDAMTRMLREELAPRGIRCVAINPGGVRTGMRAAAMPGEDPATVPHPSSVVPAFVAVAAGADPGWRVEAREWR